MDMLLLRNRTVARLLLCFHGTVVDEGGCLFDCKQQQTKRKAVVG